MSLLSRFLVLIKLLYVVGLLIIFLYPAISHVFHGKGFLGSMLFRFYVFQSLGPGSGPSFLTDKLLLE